MSLPPTDPRVAASADLQRVAEEGYVLEVRGGHLVVHEIPYVTSRCTVEFGKLVMPIMFAGDVAAAPNSHVALWAGEHPSHADGRLMTEIAHTSSRHAVEPDLFVDHSFSAMPKPAKRYADFYEKITAYVARISGPAESLDSTVTPRTFGVIAVRDDASVFRYTENASALAGIAALTPTLAVGKVAIVGTGGTGAYLLDFVAKTPVDEIHLFDDDEFLQHNAFRAPGAASLEELRMRPRKVEYLKTKYDPMRRGIHAHTVPIDETNVAILRDMHTVFVCVDSGPARRLIVETLTGSGVHCIIVGMGMHHTPSGLSGQVATTTAGPGRWDHVGQRVSYGTRNEEAHDAYRQNIQIAELNALNAVMAVIAWKKRCGFYADLEHEGHSAYIIEGNGLANDDQRATSP